jgi:hypothetical protein
VRDSADTSIVRIGYAIGGILLAAVLAFPAGAAAGQDGQVASLASQRCAQQRAAMGKRAFRKRYGEKHTMRTCIRRNRARVATAVAAATRDCQSELSDLGQADFVDEYGDDPTDSIDSVMAECVAENVDEILNPDDAVDDSSDDDGE